MRRLASQRLAGPRQPVTEPAEMRHRHGGVRIVGLAPGLEIVVGHRPGEVVALHQAAAEALHQIERGYDVPHFITGFESMVNDLKEQGVILDNDRKFEPKLAREDNVTAEFGL